MGREFEDEDIEGEATGVDFDMSGVELEDFGTVFGMGGMGTVNSEWGILEEECFLFVKEVQVTGDDADGFHNINTK